MMFIILDKSEFLAIVLPLHMAGVSYTHTHKHTIQKNIHFSRETFPDFGAKINNKSNKC